MVVNGTPAPKTSAKAASGPEVATGYRRGMTAVRTAHYAVATANPLATQAACQVLRDGGSAADALVTAQAVLGLVEPQSSGLGGGGFLLYYDAASNSLQAYDGRETAPAAATENYLRWIDDVNHALPQPNPRASGRSIGIPGILRLLELVHNEHGRTPWRDLFSPAIGLADNGFAISPRLAAAVSDAAPMLRADPAAASYFVNPDGSPKTTGTHLTNPAYAKTLGAIASDGPQVFYTGDIAHDLVAAAADTTGGRTPSLMTPADLAGYAARKRHPLCIAYREHELCSTPPPSGGIAVLATMGTLANFPMRNFPPTGVDLNGGRPSVMGVHLVTEAERLAYADRYQYVADTDFVPLPGGSPDTLLNTHYLAGRAALMAQQHTMGTAQPGNFGAPPTDAPPPPEHGTSHISVVDAQGNAASFTTTIESNFGSFHMVDGFMLNNELTDFSAQPSTPDGTPVANRIQAGKRPRSSISPILIFDHGPSGRGPLSAVTGSPGGLAIIQHVTKTLVSLLDWGLNPQQAVSAVDFGATNSPITNVGGEHPAIDNSDGGNHDPLVEGLRALGHQVDVADQSSGLSAIARSGSGWIGGADPRREGLVMGDLAGRS
ncbi:gamma-glutamyltransferase family protein [Mycobacterium sp.]|uniref:gamma-glutamyltransferase family protein n=1 Tax=Mycobacterium sp. TaxID=1785 RepID=UPI0039C8EE3B